MAILTNENMVGEKLLLYLLRRNVSPLASPRDPDILKNSARSEFTICSEILLRVAIHY